MALQGMDLNSIYGIRFIYNESKRNKIWICCEAIKKGIISHDVASISDVEFLMNKIGDDKYFLEHIQNKYDQIARNDELDFLNQRLRQTLFLEKILQAECIAKNIPAITAPPGLNITPEEAFIAKLDTLDLNAVDRRNLLADLRTAWANHLVADTMYNWFKSKYSEKKLEYFKEWIRNQPSISTWNLQPFYLLDAEFIQIYYDITFNSIAEVKLNIEKFKKAWNTKTYREKSSGKKQCNIALRSDCIKILEDLSAKHRYTKSQILEILLLAEKSHGHYIRKKLKEIDALYNQ